MWFSNMEDSVCKLSGSLFEMILDDRGAEIKSLLEQGANPNYRVYNWQTPVHIAVCMRSEKAAEYLLLLMEHKGDIFARDSFGGNVLHYLTRWSPVTAVPHDAYLALALNWMGVPLDARGLKGFQPIHWAASRANDTLLKLYLDLGANANALADGGLTPLHLAARSEVPPTTLPILLKRGANIQQKMSDGRSALHEACINSLEHNVRILLSAGADLLAEDRDGKTPFALCIDQFHDRRNTKIPSIIKLMIKALALKRDDLQPSIELKDESLVKSSPKLWDYYRYCRAQIAKMKLTWFTESCSFYELLTRSSDRIAGLMRASDFEANFRLYDLKEFSMYGKDILEAFERAQRRCRFVLEREDFISVTFYGTLPDVFARKMVRYLWEDFELDECRYFKC